MSTIWDFLFGNGGFSPHGFCIAWNPAVLYLHIFSDLLIAASYFAIPAVILIFLRRRQDPRLHGPATLFVAFITACGVTHLISVMTMYVPAYGFQGLAKLVTGLISFVTALVLIKMLPDALKIPAPDQLDDALRMEEEARVRRARAEKEVRQGQRELAAKVSELEATNSELKEFAYAASHDLKSPANTLNLWLEDFRAEHAEALDDEGREALEDAGLLIERMRGLVEDVLCFSRVVNRAPDDVAEVDMHAVFDNARDNLGDAIRSSGAVVDIGALPPVEGYRSLMLILAQNLLSNAVKFAHPDRAPQVRVTGRVIDGPVPFTEISVRDNGIGIEEAHRDRIFKLFKRLHRREVYDGSGLGLALCRRIVITHGGRIEVRSNPGEGSEFIVSLPQKEGLERAAA